MGQRDRDKSQGRTGQQTGYRDDSQESRGAVDRERQRQKPRKHGSRYRKTRRQELRKHVDRDR